MVIFCPRLQTDDIAGSDLKYLDDFIKLACAPKLLKLRMFPDCKEIAESMAVWYAVVRTEVLNEQREPVRAGEAPDTVVVVGDGVTPRTAALFAFRAPQWRCVSVDPMLRFDSPSWKAFTNMKSCGTDDDTVAAWTAISRLVMLRRRIEQVPAGCRSHRQPHVPRKVSVALYVCIIAPNNATPRPLCWL